jgi:predicted TPR repeat methyltransferase
MPGSSYQGKEQIVQWVRYHSNIKTVLDVGCGEGTYPNILKDNFELLTNATWWGVEAWKKNIEEFELEKKYFKVLNEDVRLLKWETLPRFDLVIFGDVLEHMTKEESQVLVNAALAHSKYVVISIPVKHMPQDAVGGNPFEVHVKDDWTHEEVLESFPHIKLWSATKKIGVYWLTTSVL